MWSCVVYVIILSSVLTFAKLNFRTQNSNRTLPKSMFQTTSHTFSYLESVIVRLTADFHEKIVQQFLEQL